jgi:transposase, IS5 family
MAGLAILKHTYDLSDQALCERWAENPNYQYFCDEEFFQHRLVYDRSSMTCWRYRAGEDRLQALIRRACPSLPGQGDQAARAVDTTVEPKNVTFPTDAKLLNRASEKPRNWCGWPSSAECLTSILCAGGQVCPDPAAALCPRQTVQARQPDAEEAAHLSRQRHSTTSAARSRATAGSKGRWRGACASRSSISAGPKVYSLHAPEVEWIGKGTAHRPYEFGVKVSVATALSHAKGGQFVTHAKALSGSPYDGHTLATVIPDIEALIGNTIARILADKGYRGQDARPTTCLKCLHLRPEARGDTQDQARIASQVRRRARHRPSQSRAPHGPKLSLLPRGAMPPTPSSTPPATTSVA